jgi:imidazolonepropionase-like amidohydrolase
VKVAINTDDSVTESRFYLRTGSIAVRGGMSEDSALKALTLNAAQMMHLDHRVGSLEKGKDADFAVLSGKPFSSYTLVLQTYIDGVKIFDRGVKKDWSYQAGGFAVSKPDLLPNPPAPQKPLASVKAPAPAPEKTPALPKAIHAGRIHTGTGKVILDGVILIEQGRITAVGTKAEVAIPEKAEVISVAEVTPGLIDAHSSCGLSGAWNIPADQDQDESSDPNQADLRVLDGFNPNEPLLEFLRANGVTNIHATPGRVNVIAGQTGIFRTAGSTVEKMTVRFPAAMLVNLGESSKGVYAGKLPLTRMGTANLLRSQLTLAKANLAKKSSKEDEKKLGRNLKLEAFEPMLEGKLPVIFAAHRGDDLLTALRIAEEFKLKPILSLGSEAYLISDEIAKAKVPVIVHPTMQRAASSIETMHASTANSLVLSEKQVPLAICTGFEGYVPKSRMLRVEAGMAMAHGLGHAKALRAVTLDAAKLLGIDDKYGSIEAGKVADLVLYDGDPLENATHVQYTLMDGRVVFDRAEYLKIPFARRILAVTSGGGDNCCLGW